MIAGLFGVFLYYYLENVALTYTLAMNVGIIGLGQSLHDCAD
jgi:hypothetical protein